MLKAVVLVPLGPDHLLWLSQAANYCAAKGYEVVAVAFAWHDAIRYLLDGRAELVVTPRLAFVSWLEVIEEQPDPQRQPRRRRPRLLG